MNTNQLNTYFMRSRIDTLQHVDSERVTQIKSYLDLEMLVFAAYPELENQARAIEPTRLKALWKRHKLRPEAAVWRLPSPSRSPGDRTLSVIVLPRNGLWYDCEIAHPELPPDIVGFVMAYDGVSYEAAVDKLERLVTRLKDCEKDAVALELQAQVLEQIRAATKPN